MPQMHAHIREKLLIKRTLAKMIKMKSVFHLLECRAHYPLG
jgi:hypothetical protein